MKPGFALSLSSEGISYLHRAAGGWRNIGTVALDHPDLRGALADLHSAGDAMALSEPDCCKLVIPNDQIRYLTIETGAIDARQRRDLAEAALEGATPYAVADLAFDISEDGALTHIAAVARETLAEAESFAVDHGFSPASFVAIPGDMDFLGEPFFGQAKSIGDSPIEPDGIAVVDIGPVLPPTQPQPSPSPAEAEPQAADPDPSREGSTKSAASAAQDSTTKPHEIDNTPAAPSRTGLTLAAATEQDLAESEDLSSEDSPTQDEGPALGFSSRRRKNAKSPAAAVKPPVDTSANAKTPALAGASRNTPKPIADVDLTANKPVPAKEAVGGPKSAAAVLKAQEKSLASELAAAALTQPSAPGLGLSAPAATKGGSWSRMLPSGAGLTSAATGVFRWLGKSRTADRPEKSRNNMGLILTALLLIFMLAVAALAYFSGSGPFARFTETDPVEDKTLPTALAPDTVEPGTADTTAADGEQAKPTPTETAPAEPTPETGEAIVPALPPQPLVSAEPTERPIAPQVSAFPGQPDPGVTFLPEEQTAADTPQARAPAEENLARLDPNILNTPGDTGTEQTEQDALAMAAQYAATGIWQVVPEITEVPAIVDLGNIYVASIDHTDLSQDAVALPAQPEPEQDEAPDVISSPAAAGSSIALNPRGLVEATPEGTVNPDGVMVYLGRPPVVPPPTPPRADPEALAAEEAEAAAAARLAALSRLRPRARPVDLAEQVERSQLGGRSRAELAGLRPRARPQTLKTEEEENQPATEQAVATSVSPRARPANFANIVDRARRSTPDAATAAAVPAAASVAPRIPSSASVARQATISNAINLRRLNLIGVYGTAANRRALVRLPSGRYRKVQVGDRLDGGQVVAIGEAQLQYQKSGRNQTLKMPE